MTPRLDKPDGTKRRFACIIRVPVYRGKELDFYHESTKA
jgi:hypothetical protein